MEKNNFVIGIITTVVIVVAVGAVLLIQYSISKEKQNEIAKTQQVTEVKEESKKKVTEEIDYVSIAKEQLSKAKKGEKIAIMHIKDKGMIKLKFFEKEAPKAVENFLTHAKNGYYNGHIFHRVINEFMIQGGDPTGTGTGGESVFGEPFEKEVDIKRFPFRGTLCMASSSLPKSLGSQFFITQANKDQVQIEKMQLQGVPKNLIDAYKEFGGAPHLFMGYTVFGQVIEGMDIVDEIAKVKTDIKDKPLENVVIEKIEVLEEANE